MNKKTRFLVLGTAIAGIMYLTDFTKIPFLKNYAKNPVSVSEKVKKEPPAIKARSGQFSQLNLDEIILDAGHVGEENGKGAEQPHGWLDVVSGKYSVGSKLTDYFRDEKGYAKEPEYTWAIVRDLKSLIKEYSPKTKVILTATPNENTTLLRKMDYINSLVKDGSVLISVHIDYDKGGNAKAYYSQSRTGERTIKEEIIDLFKKRTLKNTKLEEVNELTKPILYELGKKNIKNKGVMRDIGNTNVGHLGILYGPKKSGGYDRDFNAVLFEILSMNNPEDCKYLEEHSMEIAEAIYKGLCNYSPRR